MEIGCAKDLALTPMKFQPVMVARKPVSLHAHVYSFPLYVTYT
jgi:hypothetical protein